MEVLKEDIVRLRKISGQPIMDCKRALAKEGSFDEAFEYLRKNATEKIDADRKNKVMSEGRVIIKGSQEHPVAGSKLAMVSLLCETDFTAKSDAFKNKLDEIADLVLSFDGALTNELHEGPINDALAEIKSQTGENVRLGEAYIMIVPDETSVGAYVHFDNKKAAIVQFDARTNPASLQEIGTQIAMHVVATRPKYLNQKECSLDRNKDVSIPKDIDKKPENIRMQIINGVFKKYMKETVLLEQPFCLDDSITVNQAILKVRRAEMMEITLKKFKHIEIGE